MSTMLSLVRFIGNNEFIVAVLAVLQLYLIFSLYLLKQCNHNADNSYNTRCSENNLLNQQAIAFQTSVNVLLMNENVVQYQYEAIVFENCWRADARRDTKKYTWKRLQLCPVHFELVANVRSS